MDLDDFIGKHGTAPVRMSLLSSVLRKIISPALTDHNRRLKALEGRPQIEYRGTFEAGKTYREGALVTDKGSLWLATRETGHRPPDVTWKLVVKRGDHDVR
jgi:hypothetical protein